MNSNNLRTQCPPPSSDLELELDLLKMQFERMGRRMTRMENQLFDLVPPSPPPLPRQSSTETTVPTNRQKQGSGSEANLYWRVPNDPNAPLIPEKPSDLQRLIKTSSENPKKFTTVQNEYVPLNPSPKAKARKTSNRKSDDQRLQVLSHQTCMNLVQQLAEVKKFVLSNLDPQLVGLDEAIIAMDAAIRTLNIK